MAPYRLTPTLTTETGEPLADLLHFMPIDRKRIILPDEAVPELMARILELQQPAREEHFRRQVRSHAELVSLSS